jgi:Phosphotransferase enzyme family
VETIYRNLARFLMQRGLLSRADLVDGGLTMAMGRSRNRHILIKRRHGGGLFVKQALETEAMTAQTVAREAEVYRGAFADDRLAALRDLLPVFHLHDPAQGMLVTDMVADAETLASCHKTMGACPPDLARRIGAALAGYHAIRFAEGRPQAALFPQDPPWILKLHREPDLSTLRRSAAASALIDLLLATPDLGDRLGRLRDDWRRDTLIHTDMRWENVLLAPRRAPLPDRRLYVVDWELADIGDAAWDLAGMLQSYLNHWLASIPATAGSDPAAQMAAARHPLDTVQPAIGALWEGYLATTVLDRDTPAAFLARTVAMMGARMLVTAFEMSAWRTALDAQIGLMVQVALNVLARPEDAARDLLGIHIAPPLVAAA